MSLLLSSFRSPPDPDHQPARQRQRCLLPFSSTGLFHSYVVLDTRTVEEGDTGMCTLDDVSISTRHRFYRCFVGSFQCFILFSDQEKKTPVKHFWIRNLSSLFDVRRPEEGEKKPFFINQDNSFT